MYCPNCGVESADNVPFCANCGSSLQSSQVSTSVVAPIPVPAAAPAAKKPLYKKVGFWLLIPVFLAAALCVLIFTLALLDRAPLGDVDSFKSVSGEVLGCPVTISNVEVVKNYEGDRSLRVSVTLENEFPGNFVPIGLLDIGVAQNGKILKQTVGDFTDAEQKYIDGIPPGDTATFDVLYRLYDGSPVLIVILENGASEPSVHTTVNFD